VCRAVLARDTSLGVGQLGHLVTGRCYFNVLKCFQLGTGRPPIATPQLRLYTRSPIRDTILGICCLTPLIGDGILAYMTE